nr:GNAT family N-acetyltransferase [Rhodoferax sp.]
MPNNVTFTLASPIAHRDAILRINIEYMAWVTAGIEKSFGLTSQALLGMDVAEYVAGVMDKVCGELPPRGAFYLVYVDGDLAGMGGLRPLGEGVGEIKRIYVRPTFRGMNLGQSILHRLLTDAHTFGYLHVCLDSAPFMQSAQRIYVAAGFVDRGPYEGLEVPELLHPGWRFMERIAAQPR